MAASLLQTTWETPDQVPSAVRYRLGAELDLEGARFWQSAYQTAMLAGISDEHAQETAWQAFESRFRLDSTGWTDKQANQRLNLNLGLIGEYLQSVQERDGMHIQALAGSTTLDVFETAIDPTIVPRFRDQAQRGETLFQNTHDMMHAFPMGHSTRTIPADKWELFPWEKVSQHVQAKDPTNVLVYDFKLKENHPYMPLFVEELQQNVPFSFSMGMLGVFPRSVWVPGRQAQVGVLTGAFARADHVALLRPKRGANPDANHGFVGVAMQDVFAGQEVLGFDDRLLTQVMEGTDGWMQPLAGYHAASLIPSSKADKGSIRTKEERQDGKPVLHIFGKVGGKMELLSIHYPMKNWKLEEVKKACPTNARVEAGKAMVHTQGESPILAASPYAASSVSSESPRVTGGALFLKNYHEGAATTLYHAQVDALSQTLRSVAYRHQEDGASGTEAELREVLSVFVETVVGSVLSGSALRNVPDLEMYFQAALTPDGDTTDGGEDMTPEQLREALAALPEEERAAILQQFQGATRLTEAEAAEATAAAEAVTTPPVDPPTPPPTITEPPPPTTPAGEAEAGTAMQAAFESRLSVLEGTVTQGLEGIRQEIAEALTPVYQRLGLVEGVPVAGAVAQPLHSGEAGEALRALPTAPAFQPVPGSVVDLKALEAEKGFQTAREAGREIGAQSILSRIAAG